MVTHDRESAALCDRVVTIEDGRIVCAEDFMPRVLGDLTFSAAAVPASFKRKVFARLFQKAAVPGQSLGSQKMAERKKSHLLLSFSFALRFILQIRL